MRIARAYHFSLDQIEEMDYLAYLLALKDIADCPLVDKTLMMMFGGKGKSGMSISDARKHYRKKAR